MTIQDFINQIRREIIKSDKNSTHAIILKMILCERLIDLEAHSTAIKEL